MGNTVKDDVIVVGGREFRRVKNGLDEAQVTSVIEELVRERDQLAEGRDHIASLNRLAEISVVEADKLAAQIKGEASEQAKAESAAVIDRAREQARQVSEKKMAEAVKAANEQANEIKAKAEEEAMRLLENQKNKIRGELRNLVNQQFGYMLEELEGLKKQAAAVQADFGNKLSEAAGEESTLTARIVEERDAADEAAEEAGDSVIADLTEERDAAVAHIAKERDAVMAEFARKMDAAAVEIDRDDDSTIVETSRKANDEPSELGQATDNTEESRDLGKLLQMEEEPDLGKPQWEVEILAPFDISKIMEVVSFLDGLPEVANTEMIVPQIDMPSILVFLRKPISFVDVLRTIPAVASVEEVTPKTASANGKARKVRISLLRDTKSQAR
jgi:hypothetical protein